MKNLITFLIFICAFIVLSVLGLLDPAIEFLSSERMSLKVGATELSAYGIAKLVLVAVVFVWISKIVAQAGGRLIQNIKHLRSSNKQLLKNIFKVVVYSLALVVFLDIVGIDLTALAFLGGAIGIGIGFGLQKITSNFISGIILLFEKTIKENDLVELSDGTFGYIKYTGARYTLFKGFEGQEMMIPNEEFISSPVTNWTYTDTMGRVTIRLGVSYDADLEQARSIMLESAREHPKCSKQTDPSCFLEEFADNSVNFMLIFWVDDVNEGRLGPKSDVMFSIYNKFKEKGIEIPYPQRDVHIKSTAQQLPELK